MDIRSSGSSTSCSMVVHRLSMGVVLWPIVIMGGHCCHHCLLYAGGTIDIVETGSTGWRTSNEGQQDGKKNAQMGGMINIIETEATLGDGPAMRGDETVKRPYIKKQWSQNGKNTNGNIPYTGHHLKQVTLWPIVVTDCCTVVAWSIVVVMVRHHWCGESWHWWWKWCPRHGQVISHSVPHNWYDHHSTTTVANCDSSTI